MASGYSRSPRQAPSRLRVKELRDKYEALSDKSSGKGSGKETSPGSGAESQVPRSRRTTKPLRTDYLEESLEEPPSFTSVLESSRRDGQQVGELSEDMEPTGMEPEGFQYPGPSRQTRRSGAGPSGGFQYPGTSRHTRQSGAGPSGGFQFPGTSRHTRQSGAGPSGGFQFPGPSRQTRQSGAGPSGGLWSPHYSRQPQKAQKKGMDYEKWYEENKDKVNNYDSLCAEINRLLSNFSPDIDLEEQYPVNVIMKMLNDYIQHLISKAERQQAPEGQEQGGAVGYDNQFMQEDMQDSYESSPHGSRRSSGFQPSSPHSSDSSHGPPRSQQRRRRRGLANVYDPENTYSSPDQPRRPNVNEPTQHSSDLTSMSNDDRSRRRHESDRQSPRSSLTTPSPAPMQPVDDDDELIETDSMEYGSEDSSRRGGLAPFHSDIEELLATRKLEPKPNTSGARREAFQDRLNEINREAEYYSATPEVTEEEGTSEHSHSSQEHDGSAVDEPEDANQTGSYRAPSPDRLGRLWSTWDLEEQQHGSRRGSPDNIQEEAEGGRAQPPQNTLNRRWGPRDFAEQFGQNQGQARGPAQDFNRRMGPGNLDEMLRRMQPPPEHGSRSGSSEHSSRRGSPEQGSRRGSPDNIQEGAEGGRAPPPQNTLNRRWGPRDFAEQFGQNQGQARGPAQDFNRRMGPSDLSAQLARMQVGTRSPAPSTQRSYSSHEEDARSQPGSARGTSDFESSNSIGRGQPTNPNATFTGRRQPQNPNATFTMGRQSENPNATFTMGRQPENPNATFTRQPVNPNETFVRSPGEERHSAPSSHRSYSSQEEEQSPRFEPQRQQQNLNRRWGPDDFNQQAENEPQHSSFEWSDGYY